MLNVEQLDVIEKVIDKYNNEDVIDSLSSHFRTNALNKAIPNLVFAKVTPIQNLSNVELICLVEGLFELTKLSIITPSKLFSKEELEEYDNLKQGTSNYTPSTIQRELDENDRKILRFLNETYGNYNTKHTYFFIYDTKIKSEEKENQKELALFTPVSYFFLICFSVRPLLESYITPTIPLLPFICFMLLPIRFIVRISSRILFCISFMFITYVCVDFCFIIFFLAYLLIFLSSVVGELFHLLNMPFALRHFSLTLTYVLFVSILL